MGKQKYVVLGGGMVAGYAARELVAVGVQPAEICIISADSVLPYERPPLSKDFLAGETSVDGILINDNGFYGAHRVNVRLNTRVTSNDLRDHCILTDDGERIEFEKLLIATGARPRRLQVPGAGLDGVMYLRTVADSEAIRSRSEGVERAVTIGGGFISMEVAAVLTKRGLDVTMVFPQDRVWAKVFTPEISAFFERYYEERGVRLARGQHVAGIAGDGAVRSVQTSSGDHLDAGIVVVGIGIEPALDGLDGGGLRIDNGIVVNEYLETGVPDVYAAGDVVRYRDLLFGDYRRADHWDNAVEQGKHVARVITGDRTPFVRVPYFFSDVFDLSYEYWGDSRGATSVTYRGDVASGEFSAWWQRHETVIAAFVMNRPDEERELAPRWIAERTQVAPDEIRSASSLRSIRI